MRYLIDTDYAISYLKGIQSKVEKLQALEGKLAISVISLGEILEGIYGHEKQKEMLSDLKDFLTDIKVLNVDREIVDCFAQERNSLRKAGKLIDNMDLLVASTARVYKLTLVTGNTKHFKRVKNLEILNKL